MVGDNVHECLKIIQARERVKQILKIYGATDEEIEKAFAFIYQDNWRTIQEMSKDTGYEVRRIYDWIRRDVIKHIKFGNRILVAEKPQNEEEQTENN